jgi:nicotinamidase-related amidase
MSSQADSPNTALIIVDVQKDNVGRYSQAIIPNIQLLIKRARGRGIPVIYACDSRYADDYIFKRLGRKPHAIRGTDGVKVVDELSPAPGETVIEKRMLSGFFGTDLDFTLREKGIVLSHDMWHTHKLRGYRVCLHEEAKRHHQAETLVRQKARGRNTGW